jgi:hypothetical protein
VFTDPNRRVALVAIDMDSVRRWRWPIAAAVVGAVWVATANGTPTTKPRTDFASKFEWILMEPQSDGRMLATTFRTSDACRAAAAEVAEKRVAMLRGGADLPNDLPADCVPGKLIEDRR